MASAKKTKVVSADGRVEVGGDGAAMASAKETKVVSAGPKKAAKKRSAAEDE